MSNLAKTLTKRDCDEIIKSFEEMQRCAQLSIDALKQMDIAVEEASKTVHSWRDSIAITTEDKECFRLTVRNYCHMNGLIVSFNDSYNVTKMCFYVKKTGIQYPEVFEVPWYEAMDIGHAIRTTIKRINEDILGF